MQRVGGTFDSVNDGFDRPAGRRRGGVELPELAFAPDGPARRV